MPYLNEPKNRCSIVVSSCDGYSDVWNPFFTLFFRYFPDNPFPLYLISETKMYDDPRVGNISIIDDKKWASNLILALDRIDTPFIIYLQEDYLLKGPADLGRLEFPLDLASEKNIGHIRLLASPPPGKKYDDQAGLGEIVKGSPYSVSLQAGIWNVRTLRALLKEGESGWEMEFKGSERSFAVEDAFLSVLPGREPIPYYATAIKKGRWFYDALELCRQEGIDIEIRRPVESFDEYKARHRRRKPFIGSLLKAYDRVSRKLRSIMPRRSST